MELIYTSNIIYLDIEKYDHDQEKELDGGIILTETYKPNPSYHGEYRLIIKREVNSTNELSEYHEKIWGIVELLNKLIYYAIFHHIYETNDLYGTRTRMIELGKSKGWTSNFSDINHKLEVIENPHRKILFDVSFEGYVSHSCSQTSPFEQLMALYDNYCNFNESERLLLRFHSTAMENESDVKYMLLGKTLEIAKELFPKRDDKKMLNLLSQPVQEEFKSRSMSIAKLYELSNFRAETRHIIKQKAPNILFHGRMSDHEYENYMYCTDMLVVNMIRLRCGLPCIALTP